jgi:hypothetical protein
MWSRRTRFAGVILVVALVVLASLGTWATGGAAQPERNGPRAGDVNKCRTKQRAGVKSCVPPAPGAARLRVVTVRPNKSGRFKPFTSANGEERANEDQPWRAPGAPVRGTLAPTVKPFGVRGAHGAHEASVTFGVNTSLESTVDFCRSGGCSFPPDSSGAASGKIVLTTGNWKSFGAVSRNGGATFKLFDPTTIFPSGPTFTTVGGRRVQLDGGMCCDQVIQYVPQINRFIWLMQFSGTCGGTCGTNKERIAAATPAVVANGGTWTYWDLASATFGLPSANPSLDYPDMAVGDKSLYVSVDNVGVGLLVMRIPLSQIAAASSINIGYTTPSDSATAYGGHLTQNVRDTAYWAGHVNNGKMRIFSMKDSENVYRWRDVSVNSWCNGNRSSSAPSGTDWLAFGFPGNAVLGSTLRPTDKGDQLWFAWGAGHAMAAGTPGKCQFPQSHIQIEVLNPSNFSPIGQMQVWNKTIAFAYPSLASDPRGDVAMSLGYGGGGNDASHAVGFWGDFVVFPTATSDTSINRFGDFLTVRRASRNGNSFSAAGYGTKVANKTNGCPSNSTQAAGFGSSQNFCFDPHYVTFGR